MAWNEYEADLQYKIQNEIWLTRMESEIETHKWNKTKAIME